MAICETEDLARAKAQTAGKKAPIPCAQVFHHSERKRRICSKGQGSIHWFFDRPDEQSIHEGGRSQGYQVGCAQKSDSVSKDFGKNYSSKAAEAQER